MARKHAVVLLVLLIVAHASVMSAAAAQVTIEAMLVELPAAAMDKLGIEWPAPGGGVVEVIGKEPVLSGKSTLKQANISPKRLKMLKEKLLAGKIEANVLSTPCLAAIDKREASLKIGEEVHYMEKIGDELYKLRSLDNVGLTFAVTPTVINDVIRMSLDLGLTQVKERMVVPEATDLNIGLPMMSTWQVSTNVTVKDGETVLLGGVSHSKEASTLLFLTAKSLP